MIKTFCDNIELVEVELIDKDGNKVVKKSKFLTTSDLKKMDAIKADVKKNEGNFDVLCKQMAFVFGGKYEEYLNTYSFPMLKAVMDYVKEVFLINPLVVVQRK